MVKVIHYYELLRAARVATIANCQYQLIVKLTWKTCNWAQSNFPLFLNFHYPAIARNWSKDLDSW